MSPPTIYTTISDNLLIDRLDSINSTITMLSFVIVMSGIAIVLALVSLPGNLRMIMRAENEIRKANVLKP